MLEAEKFISGSYRIMHVKWYLCNWNLTFQVIFKSSLSVLITISATTGGASCVNVRHALKFGGKYILNEQHHKYKHAWN